MRAPKCPCGGPSFGQVHKMPLSFSAQNTIIHRHGSSSLTFGQARPARFGGNLFNKPQFCPHQRQNQVGAQPYRSSHVYDRNLDHRPNRRPKHGGNCGSKHRRYSAADCGSDPCAKHRAVAGTVHGAGGGADIGAGCSAANRASGILAAQPSGGTVFGSAAGA